uniref:SET domain-containing protein n=1 Tax=Chromera velia CCMP2878 TaxID=1169474 RepID=A0A0G4HPX9_9ALVE|eukprot:Cvel_1237.t1-p1 / transcript=Cvel_1237.t1 / gene=Cvel_1237 / organism=Chromera_velia_CCMP2878 / gene_product=hypothetical protein / transcript_product=hypothetical protein / location=Cvel_scaffold41:95558-99030(+) / protein_length=629 / sequence_SO=supercontig / SO=protein_coding / is_pseudo=false
MGNGEKGIGLFASRDIQAGQIIMMRWPMSVVPVSETNKERAEFMEKFSPPADGGRGVGEGSEERSGVFLEADERKQEGKKSGIKDAEEDEQDTEEVEKGELEEEDEEETFLERVDVARLCLSLVSKIVKRRALFPELSNAPFLQVLPALQILQPRETEQEWKRKSSASETPPEEFTCGSPSLDAHLERELERAGAQTKYEQQRFLWAVALNAMGTYPGGPEQLSHAEQVGDSAGEGEGVGLFDFPSLFNHSCQPNVNRYFMGLRRELSDKFGIRRGEEDGEEADGPREPLAIFVACRDISAGEELCISYIESEVLCEDRTNRGEALQEGAKGFTCGCPACLREKEQLRLIQRGKRIEVSSPVSYEPLPDEIKEVLSLPSPPQDRIRLIDQLLAEVAQGDTDTQTRPRDSKQPKRLLATADHLELLQTRAQLRALLLARASTRKKTKGSQAAKRQGVDEEQSDNDLQSARTLAHQYLQDWRDCISFIEGRASSSPNAPPPNRRGPGFPPNEESLVVFHLQASRGATALASLSPDVETETFERASKKKKKKKDDEGAPEKKGGKLEGLAECMEHLKSAKRLHARAFGGGPSWFLFRYKHELLATGAAIGGMGQSIFQLCFNQITGLSGVFD